MEGKGELGSEINFFSSFRTKTIANFKISVVEGRSQKLYVGGGGRRFLAPMGPIFI